MIYSTQNAIQQTKFNYSIQNTSQTKKISSQNPIYSKLKTIFSSNQNNDLNHKSNLSNPNFFQPHAIKFTNTLETQSQSILIANNHSSVSQNVLQLKFHQFGVPLNEKTKQQFMQQFVCLDVEDLIINKKPQFNLQAISQNLRKENYLIQSIKDKNERELTGIINLKEDILCKQKPTTHKYYLENHKIRKVKKPHISNHLNIPLSTRLEQFYRQDVKTQIQINPINDSIYSPPSNSLSNQQSKVKQLEQKILYYEKMEQFYLQQILNYKEDNRLLQWKLNVVVEEFLSLAMKQKIIRKSIISLKSKGIDQSIIETANRRSLQKQHLQPINYFNEKKQNHSASKFDPDRISLKPQFRPLRQMAYSQIVNRPTETLNQCMDNSFLFKDNYFTLAQSVVQRKVGPKQQYCKQNKLSSSTTDCDVPQLIIFQ